MDFQPRFVEAGGYRVRYTDEGPRVRPCGGGGSPNDAPVVLLVTPFVLAQSYRPPLRRLTRRRRVITVEMPGCGRSAKLPQPWAYEEYARWVPSFLDALGLGRVVLMGHSNSGGVVMVVAALFPGRVAAVVLADTVGADLTRSTPIVLARRVLDGALEMGLSLSGWHHLAFNLFRHTANFMHQVRLAVKADLRVYAPRVAAPALLAWGDRDHTVPLRAAHLLLKLLPDARVYVSPTGSHDWMIDHPGEFTAAVEAFLGGCADPAVARGASP
jgi:pimeloyl-ACP methyl ester carboxylesterase